MIANPLVRYLQDNTAQTFAELEQFGGINNRTSFAEKENEFLSVFMDW